MRANEFSTSAIWSLIAAETQSLLGSEIARFGISIWVYKSTNSVSAFAMLVLANSVPGILVAPFAGSIVDRYPRKKTIMAASFLGLIGTLIVLGAATFANLSLGLIIAGAAMASIGETFQWTALASTLPLMAKGEDLPRFNGFVEAGRALSLLAGPVVGGVLYGVLGLSGLLAVELVTFLIAVAVVATLTFPKPPPPTATEPTHLLADSLFGLRWLWQNQTLLRFLLIAVFANFFISIGIVLLTPYGLSVLDERSYGVANGLFGGGMLCGGLLYGALVRYTKNIHLIFGSLLALGFAYVFYGFARGILAFSVINFLFALLITLNNAASLTIWQRKIPEEFSGRVLAAVRMVASGTGPVAYLLAGPLSERIVPAVFASGGDAIRRIVQIWGDTQTGRMGFLFSVMGACLVPGFVVASFDRGIRRIDDA